MSRFSSLVFHIPFSKLATYMVLMCMEWAEADPFLNQGISVLRVKVKSGWRVFADAPRFSRRAKQTVDSSSISTELEKSGSVTRHRPIF